MSGYQATQSILRTGQRLSERCQRGRRAFDHGSPPLLTFPEILQRNASPFHLSMCPAVPARHGQRVVIHNR